MSEKTTELTAELDELYKKAKSQEEYEEAIKKGQELKSEAKKKYFATLANGKNLYWSRYYLLLKFSDPEREAITRFEANSLLEEIEDLCSRVSSPETTIELLYLESVIYSQLLKDTEAAKKLNDFIKTMISDNRLPLSFLLQSINARGIKEMNDKNWEMAIKIFREILSFSEEELNGLSNPDSAANIFSNLGASILRGDINKQRDKRLADIKEARKYLKTAEAYYRKKNPPSEKHLQGIANRQAEADRAEAAINEK